MRKILSTICVLILMLVIPGAYLFSRTLPADNSEYISQKYAGWSGVLQAWVYCDWESGGSFITWLNRCAARFEKQHEGVYIEFTPVSRQAMGSLGSSGILPPQMLLFSPGVVSDPNPLAETGFPDSLRRELRMDARALPVAMGGSIWVVNPEGADEAALLSERHAPGMIALLSGGGETAIEIEEPGLDLGLPVFAREELALDESALSRFMNGEIKRLAVNAAELSRLVRLRESGRGPDWVCEAAGEFACADQLLLCSVLQGDDELVQLCREFAYLLLEEESQASLAGIGAYSVCGETIHAGRDPRSQLDALLNSLPLAVPHPFSEHSLRNAAAIVRGVMDGSISPTDAAAKFGFSFSLPNQPN